MMSPLFQQVKSLYLVGQRFDTHRTALAGYDMKEMAKVMVEFAPYLLAVYDCLFVEMPDGVAGIVTAINDHGIRVEFPLPQRGNWDWITPDDIEQFKLVWQPDYLDMMESKL